MKPHQKARAPSQVQVVELDSMGYSTVSADAAFAEVVAPALVYRVQLSLWVAALLAVPASLVARNRVPSAVMQTTM